MNIKEIRPQNLRSVYMEIAEAYDLETAIKIQKLFGGQKITFPKKLFNNVYMNTYIKENYNVHNIRELTQKFGISERRIKQIKSKFK